MARVTPALSRLRLRLPGYVANGIAVALGVALIQLLFGALAGPHVAQWALSGAVCASLADVPNTPPRTWRRVSAAALLSVAAAALVASLRWQPLVLGAGIMLIGFVAMMAMAWGPRAGAVSFSPILALVFTMAQPTPLDSVPVFIAWNAAGALAYLGWSLLAALALQRRYRTQALAGTLQAVAGLLRSRAALLESLPKHVGRDAAMRDWIRGESELAEQLQTARDFLFAAPDSARSRRATAALLHAIDLRDLLLASRLDLDLLGSDTAGRQVLAQVAQRLQRFGQALQADAEALRDGRPVPPQDDWRHDLQALFDDPLLHLPDARQRLLPAMSDRLLNIAADVERIHQALGGGAEPPPLTRQELQRFVAPEGWPLAALRAQMSFGSPVLRHALRTTLALGGAYGLALLLPWASHPHWLVLSVAVVLRGNLEQTLSRRNARVLGTMLGCASVLLLSHAGSAAALQIVFLVAVGTAHSFVNRRYWLTSVAATVMALLQSHMADPAGGFAIAERVADTLLGAALAWGFSYVLPSWERRSLPRSIGGLLKVLRDYALRALGGQPVDAVEQRLARRRAYDALAALAAVLQRSGAEPAAVQVPLQEVAALLDHGQRLMAHLSMVRLTLARRGVDLAGPEATAALQQAAGSLAESLSLNPPRPGARPDAEAAAPTELPPEAPGENILPWLRRRLQLLAADGWCIHDAARRALAPPR